MFAQSPFSSEAFSAENILGNVSVQVSGVEANGQTGTVSFRLSIKTPVTGVVGSALLNPVGVSGDADNVLVAGTQATVNLGQAATSAAAIVFPVGVEGVVFEGETDESSGATVNVTGVSGTVAVGSVIVRLPEQVFVTGVSAKGKIGRRVLVWSEINDSQDADWQDISTIDDPNWEKVAA